MPTPKKKKKRSRKEEEKRTSEKMEMKSTTAQHTGSEKSCKARKRSEQWLEVFLEKWKKKMIRWEVLNEGSKQLETSRKPNSPTNWSINSTNRNVPRGHDLWSAATTHLIRREIPRVAYNPKTFHLLWSLWHVTTTTESGGSWWD